MLKLFLNVIDRISEYTGKAVSFLMLPVTGYVLYGIAMRYFFHRAWGYTTATSNFFIAYFSLGAAYVYNTGAFIKVDIFTRRLPMRTRAVLNAGAFVLFFSFCFALLVTSGEVALPALAKLKLSTRLLNPVSWPVKLILPAGIILLILQGLSRFIRTVIVIVTGKEDA